MEHIRNESDKKAVDQGCTFDQEQATRAIRFIETYFLLKKTGKPIKLLPWQSDFVSRLYGWRNQDGTRRYRKAIVSTGKKAGKTELQAAILLYELLGGTTPSPFVVSASTTRENSSQIHRLLAYSIRNNKRLAALCKIKDSTKDIDCKTKDARYKAFSADAGAAEGENISALVVDELHAHRSDKLYRSLEYATIARPDGITLIISTAGDDLSSLWFDLFKYAQGVQDGTIVDTSLLAMIYTTPNEADIEDPANWYPSNPSLGVTFSEDSFRKDLDTAKQQGTAGLISFRRYRLNQFVQPEDAFIDPIVWDTCKGHVSEDTLKTAPLFVGCDLSQTTDLCSVYQVYALPDRKFYITGHSWCCEQGVRKREESNMPKYQQYAADKVLTITPGTANDYRAIRAYIEGLRAKYNLKEVICDQYNAIEMMAELGAGGITVFRQPQYHKYYTGPIKEFETAVKEQRISHDGNKLLRWSLANTRLDVDSNGNCKPSRDKSTDKIDPSIASLMAFGRAITSNITDQPKRSVYDGRGILCV